MQAPAKPDFVVIDGKAVKITRLQPVTDSSNHQFDRFQFDDAGHSPSIDRHTVLLNKSFNEPITADGRRIAKKKQAE